MTDPNDGDPPPHDVPDLEETAIAVPAGSAIQTVADRDGGVARRLARRGRIAACVLTIVAGLGALFGVLAPWTTVSATAAVLAAGSLVAAATLFRRAARWSTVAACPLPGTGGATAILGPPQRLSPGRPGALVKRRLGATVIPIRTEVDPQPGGGALVVHARADGLQLAAGDRVQVWRADRGGLGSAAPAELGGHPATKTAGRWVLSRAVDGAVFLATTRLSDTW